MLRCFLTLESFQNDKSGQSILNSHQIQTVPDINIVLIALLSNILYEL